MIIYLSTNSAKSKLNTLMFYLDQKLKSPKLNYKLSDFVSGFSNYLTQPYLPTTIKYYFRNNFISYKYTHLLFRGDITLRTELNTIFGEQQVFTVSMG